MSREDLFEAEPLAEPDAQAEREPSTEEDEARVCWWWNYVVPDFVKSTYPFDVPPDRLPFARYIFTEFGAPRFCPEDACRRAGACQGGDGPPCYRADRRALQQLLFLGWLVAVENPAHGLYEEQMAENGNRYLREEAGACLPSPGPRRKRRKRRR